ncbi:MAG TPA: RDD family protein [Candidatus Limnocylindrales bacterium]
MTEPTPAPEPVGDQPPAPSAPPAPPAEPSPAARWQAPPPVAEVPGAPGLVFSDIPSRLVAYVVDVAIVGIAGAALVIALGLGEVVQTSTSRYVWVSGWTANIAFALLGALYFVFFWTGGRRATIGQRAFDIQVGNAFDGRPLTVDQAVRRWLGYGSFLGLLGVVPSLRGFDSLAQFVWILVLLASAARSPMKQGLHDRFARSALVRPADRASGGAAMTCLVIVVVVGILFVAAIAALIYLGSRVDPLAPPPGTTI